MRLLRGSGIAGLAAMARESERDGVLLARPFLDVSKSQLIATLKKAKIGFADDPTNHDTNFTRPRLRAVMPVLAAEGGDTRNLARLASRLARANAAVEVLVDGAERYLVLRDREALHWRGNAKAPDGKASSTKASNTKASNTKASNTKASNTKASDAMDFDSKAFAAMPEEIRLRLLLRTINRFGHEGPAELGKVEALLAVLDRAVADQAKGRGPSRDQSRGSSTNFRLKQTLAGALVSLVDGRIRVEPAPRRRVRADRGGI
jgi:tRNA(Ile)-lysidine synthase